MPEDNDIITTVLFYRSNDAFVVCQQPEGLPGEYKDVLNCEVTELITNARTWPQKNGLWIVEFWAPGATLQGKREVRFERQPTVLKIEWHTMSFRRLTVQELACVYDGTWRSVVARKER